MPAYDLSGKVAIITGGAQGIGRATAGRFVASGARVVIGDLDVEAAEEAARELGPSCSAVAFDATDADSIVALVDDTRARHGAIDILHNNVAMTAEAWSTDTTVLDTDLAVWDRTMQVNLRSMFIASKAVLPHMIERSRGSIVNMSSLAGLTGSDRLVAYGTSKAAVIGFTRYLAAQYGNHGVRANCITPGTILTQQLKDNSGDRAQEVLNVVPYTRLGEPEDVADLVAFLASDNSSFINGQTVGCDGGISVRAA